MRHTSRIQNTGLANHALVGESGDLLHVVRHEVQRVGDHDNHGIGRMVANARTHLADDVSVLPDEVLTGHAWLAREA